MGGFVRVMPLAELAQAVPRCAEVGGRRIGLVNLGGTVYAFDDTCTHAHASLCAGPMSGCEIVCPLHGATFDVRSGEVTGPPAAEDLATYEVRIEGGEVLVRLD